MSSLYAADFENEDHKDKKPGFSMEGQLGIVMTTGNTQGSSVNGRLTADHETEDWSTRYLIESLYTRTQRVDLGEESRTTAQRFNGTIEADYKLLDPNQRVFLFADYEDNRFNAFDYQASVAAGWAEVSWRSPESMFRYSVGPGYNFNKRRDGAEDSSDGVIVRASAEYSYKWGTGARLRQIISTWAGTNNTRSRSETSLSAKLIDSLAMKLSVRLDHNTSPSEGNASLDTETSVALVYQFF